TPEEALCRDLWHTVQARKLLLGDPLLGPLNVGVKVANRKAVLWGPVPSQQLSSRAEQRLRTMFELTEICNRLTIEPDGVQPQAPTCERSVSLSGASFSSESHSKYSVFCYHGYLRVPAFASVSRVRNYQCTSRLLLFSRTCSTPPARRDLNGAFRKSFAPGPS